MVTHRRKDSLNLVCYRAFSILGYHAWQFCSPGSQKLSISGAHRSEFQVKWGANTALSSNPKLSTIYLKLGLEYELDSMNSFACIICSLKDGVTSYLPLSTTLSLHYHQDFSFPSLIPSPPVLTHASIPLTLQFIQHSLHPLQLSFTSHSPKHSTCYFLTNFTPNPSYPTLRICSITLFPSPNRKICSYSSYHLISRKV